MHVVPEAEEAIRHRAKAVLRQRARALRASLPRDAVVARSARVVDQLARTAFVQSATRIALFWPMVHRNEVDLTALDARLRAAGRSVAYPAVDPETRLMVFRTTEDPSTLVDRGLGFREPSPTDPEATELDVIVVPALQVDPRGHRLGYGAGFYDRTLPRFCPPGRAVAVAFDFQLVPEIPNTDGDVAVSLVVTDERVIDPADPAPTAPRRA